MMRNRSTAMLAVVISTAAIGSAAGPDDFFERRIRPLLIERCLGCHDAEQQEGGLRLDSRAGALQGGARGAALVPGDAEASLLLRAVRRRSELAMPPDDPLSAREVSALSQWVNSGAAWPSPPQKLMNVGRVSAREQRIHSLVKQHWAFQPVRKPPVPQPTAASWPRNDLDRFVLAELNRQQLNPSADAAPQALVRRLYFDVIGLPPTAGEVLDFVTDPTDDRYAQLVARLLDRREYGQRWARHWLDVARYADTTGYLEGAARRYPFAWTYRDYVVRSLNEDTPFDRFIVEQLAADQLNLQGDDLWKLSAMGFLTLGPRFNYDRHEVIDDRIDTVTRGLLGLTVSCTRCHDHKYDPVLTEDYYELYGVFANSKEPLYTDLPRVGSIGGDFPRYRRFRRQLNDATRDLEQFRQRAHRRIEHETRARVGDYLRYLVQLMPAHRTENQPSLETSRGMIRGPTPYGCGAIVRWQHYIESRSENDPVFGLWRHVAAGKREHVADGVSTFPERTDVNPLLREAVGRNRPDSMLELASVYGELLEQTYADWRQLRETVPGATRFDDQHREQLRLVLYGPDSPIVVNEDQAQDFYTSAEFDQFMPRKRTLDALFGEFDDVAAPRAMILIDREPHERIRPRVFNRGQATRPGHFVQQRFLQAWFDGIDPPSRTGNGRLDLAHVITSPQNPLTARVIVNRVWHWHFGRGLVDTPSDLGTRCREPSHAALLDWLAADFMEHGWSLKRLHRLILTSSTWRQSSQATQQAAERDPDNRWLSHMNRRRLGLEALRDSLLLVSGQLDLRAGGRPVEDFASARRTLYLLVNRDNLNETFATFDFPSPDLSTAARTKTTVPQQALFMMNSEFVDHAVSRIVADLDSEPNRQNRIDWLYRKILGRSPSDREAAIARQYVRRANHQSWRDLAHTLLMSNEFSFVD